MSRIDKLSERRSRLARLIENSLPIECLGSLWSVTDYLARQVEMLADGEHSPSGFCPLVVQMAADELDRLLAESGFDRVVRERRRDALRKQRVVVQFGSLGPRF